MIEPFRLGLVAGLTVALTTLLMGCGPAAPTNDESAPVDVAQITGSQNGIPEPPRKPAGTPSSLDKKAIEPPVLTHRAVFPEADLTAASPPLLKDSAGRRHRVVGVPAPSKVSELDVAGNSARRPHAQDHPYTWRDGDRTMTVLLQPDLTVAQNGNVETRDDIAVKTGRDDTALRTARADVGGKAIPSDLPVFRSQSGTLMTLPGGVLLALDKAWGKAETAAFFERNGIKSARVSELAYIANGFFVETEPGFPSLNLANALATLDGVRASIPNWRQDLVPQ